MIHKRWVILGKHPAKKASIQDILTILLHNRGIKGKKQTDNFITPSLGLVTAKSVGIDALQLKRAIERIKSAITNAETIVIFGDYDVDGITGTAILWETLYKKTKHVFPYIPDRVEEGYGLSIKGMTNVLAKHPKTTLVITVDNGIVAGAAAVWAKDKGIDVIITDHHTSGKQTPDAYAIVHTTNLCGAGVAYLLSQAFKEKGDIDDHLELAALGTVADLVPLTGANRAIVKFGITSLKQTKRPGLRALYQAAGIDPSTMSVYTIGHLIGPRLNATGRLASAMDSLRLLCTPDTSRAQKLSDYLERTNRERQLMMREATDHATLLARETVSSRKLIVVSHESYQQGVIGLVAGRLVEEYYRPAIVIARGKEESKASARSIRGFNIIEALRQSAGLLIDVGGHPMAAGFTLETKLIEQFTQLLEKIAEPLLTDDLLEKKLQIDCKLPFSIITKSFYKKLQTLAPFGMANAEPVFMTEDVTVEDIRVIGHGATHLKMIVRRDNTSFDAIGFGLGELSSDIHAGDTVALAYSIDENTWNGSTKLQLKVKDISKT